MSLDDVYYKLTYADRVTDSLLQIARRSYAIGRVVEVRDAARLVDNWLRADPESFGEPFRDHLYMGQTEFIGFAGPLVVRYNVHFEWRHVFLLAPFRVARWAGF